MTALPNGRRGQMLALAITALALASLWLGIAAPLLDWYAGRAETVARRQMLATRMAQVAETAPALQAELDGAARQGPPARAVLDGGTDAIAGATLQQLLQDMTTQAGASLTSVEALPVEQVGAYRRIGLHVSVTAPWTVMVALFAAIERATPRMLVDDLQLQSGLLLGSVISHPLEASFTLLAFHGGGPPP